MTKMHETVQTMALKVSPPVAVSALSMFGVPLQEWVYIVTIIYVVLQTTKFIIDWLRGK